MAGMRVPDFRLYELERRAEEALNQCPRCVQGRRVDIDLLVETNGVQVEAFLGLRRKWDTYAFPDVRGQTIFVDADLMDDPAEEKRFRFTLAEEFAHILIHTPVFANCHTAEDRLALHRQLGDELVDRLERQARALAGALLMPATTFDPLVEELASRDRNAQDEVDVDRLAQALVREYDVNFRAARKRLKIRGYHREERLGLNLD